MPVKSFYASDYLNKKIRKAMKKHGYTNESEFFRQAIRRFIDELEANRLAGQKTKLNKGGKNG